MAEEIPEETPQHTSINFYRNSKGKSKEKMFEKFSEREIRRWTLDGIYSKMSAEIAENGTVWFLEEIFHEITQLSPEDFLKKILEKK